MIDNFLKTDGDMFSHVDVKQLTPYDKIMLGVEVLFKIWIHEGRSSDWWAGLYEGRESGIRVHIWKKIMTNDLQISIHPTMRDDEGQRVAVVGSEKNITNTFFKWLEDNNERPETI